MTEIGPKTAKDPASLLDHGALWCKTFGWWGCAVPVFTSSHSLDKGALALGFNLIQFFMGFFGTKQVQPHVICIQNGFVHHF